MSMKTVWHWVLLMGLGCVSANVHASTVVDATSAVPMQRIDVLADHWIDADGSATVNDLELRANTGGMLRGGPEGPLPTLPPKALWLSVELRKGAGNESWYLLTRNPGLDDIRLYWKDGAGVWQTERSGDRIPNTQWGEPARLPMFSLRVLDDAEPRSTHRVFVRIQHDMRSVDVPLVLATESWVRQSHTWSYFAFGAYVGLVVLTVGFCMLRFLRQRDGIYLNYVAMTLAMLFVQASLTGLGAQWLWPASVWWSDVSAFASVSLYAAVGNLFVLVFTQYWRLNRRVWRIALSFAISGGVLAMVQIAAHSKALFALSNAYVVLSMVLSIHVLLTAHVRGARYALAGLLAVSPLMLGGLAPLLRNIGILGTSSFTQYGLIVGTSFEMAGLFWVLALRDADAREASIRMRELSRTDPLSGTRDIRILLQRLHEALLRCRVLKHRCAVVRAELRNHEWFLSVHGQAVADRALVLTANALQAVARDVDTVARTGKNEFKVLLEGPMDAVGLSKFAAAALAKSMAPQAMLPIGAQLQLRLSLALVPVGQVASASGSNEPPQQESAQSVLDWLCQQSDAAPQAVNNKIVAINL